MTEIVHPPEDSVLVILAGSKDFGNKKNKATAPEQRRGTNHKRNKDKEGAGGGIGTGDRAIS